MPRLPQLLGNAPAAAASCSAPELEEYAPGTFAMRTREERRRWVEVFRRAQPGFLARAAAYEERRYGRPGAGARSARFDAEFRAEMDAFEGGGAPGAADDVLSLCAARERRLRENGLHDVFDDVKREENERAVRCLPRLLDALDGERPGAAGGRWDALLRGVYAGNMFDLGADTTQRMYDDGVRESARGGEGATVSRFLELRDTMRVGRAFAEDYGRFLSRLGAGEPYAKVLFFVDNSGPDVAFGCLPLIRQFLRAGTSVAGARAAPHRRGAGTRAYPRRRRR